MTATIKAPVGMQTILPVIPRLQRLDITDCKLFAGDNVAKGGCSLRERPRIKPVVDVRAAIVI